MESAYYIEVSTQSGKGMESNTSVKINELKETRHIWNIEITDLGDHKPFLGFSLTGQYVIVGVTSPASENRVSVNSVEVGKNLIVKIPLELERHDYPAKGVLVFNGLKKLCAEWDICFIDSRTQNGVSLNADRREVDLSDFPPEEQEMHLHILGFKPTKSVRNSSYELWLRKK